PHSAAHDDGIRSRLLDERPGGPALVDVADDLFEQILEGDDAGGAAMLVQHDGHVRALPLHDPQYIVQGHGLGYGWHRARIAGCDRPFCRNNLQQVLDVQHAGDVIQIALVDRIPRMPGFRDDAHDLVRRRVDGNARHPDTRHHGFSRVEIAELEQLTQDAACIGFDDAALLAFFHDQPQLFWRQEDTARRTAADAEQPEHEIAHAIQADDERVERQLDHAHRRQYSSCR